jgi:glycosyltransferase involved in cell wall biosynthesis
LSKIKITYILSNIDKAVAFEWVAERLNQNKFELSFILLYSKEPYLYKWLKEKGVECYYIPHFGKSSYLRTLIKTFSLLRKIKPQVVHTHLLDANLIGLFAAKLAGVKTRIHTRHHSTYHHVYYPKAIKWDKLTNFLSTRIVAISENVKEVLIQRENVKKEKIGFVHHGFDLAKFQTVPAHEVAELKKKYGIYDIDYPVIGVISRYIKLKGIQHTIKAFEELLKEYPNAKLILANTVGSDKNYIVALLKELKQDRYVEIPFEPNLFALYQLFDIYVHVPINSHLEAFGQTYIEALAAGIPSIFTLSGVAPEFIKHKENAIVVNYMNSEEIVDGMKQLLSSNDLKKEMIANGKRSLDAFNLNLFIQKLEELYE